MKTYRIGVLGLTHDHVWSNLQELKESGRGTLVAAADPHPPLLERVKQLYDCSIYADPAELLAKEKLDGVYIFGDNAAGVRWTELAARRGLHVLIEKPMAVNLDGADRMLAAVRRAGTRLMVNWPFTWWPQMQHALRMARNGDLGDVWEVKYRAAHAGPREIGCSSYFYNWLYDREQNGAGALMDYCCYGAALARCLLGMPSRVVGVAGRLCKEDIVLEDNAVLVLSYARALALSEGSWSQVGHLTSYVTNIYGTQGTLLIEPRPTGRLFMATAEHDEGVAVTVPPLPPELRTASAHFLHCLETGQPFTELCSERVGRDAQEILEAGLISARKGSEVALPLTTFLGEKCS